MLNLKDYDYHLPPNLIAREPAKLRDRSKLMIYDTKKDEISFDHFLNLDKYLPPDSFLVMNQTKVLPARITLYKENGGKVKVLFLVNEQTNSRSLLANSFCIRGYVDRKVKVGEKLYFNSVQWSRLLDQEGSIFTFEVNFPYQEFVNLLNKNGSMPIPLYIKDTPLDERRLRVRYQTIFAHNPGSAAAPTASLHFTHRLFKKLDKASIKRYFLTLHVGLGTFAPVSDKNMLEKKLHEEYFEIPPDVLHYINIMKSERKRLVAVGTTVVRALESYNWASEFFFTRESHPEYDKHVRVPWKVQKNSYASFINSTQLFIYPPYDFKMVDCLITNFHLPKSSLMMLVEAFLQHKMAKRRLVNLYRMAIENKFRFYSFGDAMLIM